ncbi:F-box/WD repeat-containing protein 7-like [Asterias rubens]|uniref:F-box/WD repeat-containing protein 7-like n=1 Tax=Asterias rubens TaxID=7604 RepID=UPI00145525B4|nr:F-box/WD repeat-containing protein 7-like [Asterias rubens]
MEANTNPTTVNDTVDKDYITNLPPELTKSIFGYLSAVDLIRVASHNKHLRNVANTDLIWRPLCQEKGWERYGSITDLTKEIPYKPKDVIVKHDSTMDLVATCRWKEIYIKAYLLENNWKKMCFHVSSLKPSNMDAGLYPRPSVRDVVIDKDCLVVVMSNETIQIWDVKTDTCLHIIPAISEGVACLRVCNGKLAVGSKDGVVRLFSANSGELLHLMQGTKEESIDRILFIDTELVISDAIPLNITGDGAKHKHINVWNVEDGALRHSFKIDVEGAILRDVDYRDNMVVGAYSDKCLRLWDAVTGDCIHTLRYNSEGIAERLSCCLGSSIIALADIDDMKLIIWNKKSGENVTSVSISGDFEGSPSKCEAVEDLLVMCLAETYFLVYDKTGKLLKTVYDEEGLRSICCYGDKFIDQLRADCTDDCVDICRIFRVVSGSMNEMGAIVGELIDMIEGVDDTKMVVSSADSVLDIYHFW